jgi:signal transduction histidine kinase
LQRKNDALSRALYNLKEEIRDRKRGERNLSQLNRQIEETSRKLQDAYLWMRQQKDHWAARRYKESMIFLTTEDGRIRGFTEKALEMTNKCRSEVQEGNIQDIFRTRDGQSFSQLIRQVRPNIAFLTTLGFKDRPGHETVYEAKLTRIFINSERLTYLVLYEPPEALKKRRALR